MYAILDPVTKRTQDGRQDSLINIRCVVNVYQNQPEVNRMETFYSPVNQVQYHAFAFKLEKALNMQKTRS